MPLALTDSPLLSPDLDYALIDALAVWMYKIRNMFNEAQAQMNFADKSKQDAIVMLQNRFVVPKVQEEINLTRFE